MYLFFVEVNIEDHSAAHKRKFVREEVPTPAPLRVGDVERIQTGQGKNQSRYRSFAALTLMYESMSMSCVMFIDIRSNQS